MSDDEQRDLRRRLSRIGRRGSPKAEVQEPTLTGNSGPTAELSGGEAVSTGRGQAYRVERVFELDYQHGSRPLAALLDYQDQPQLAAQVAKSPELAETQLSELAFLDTETTGLAGGAGTLVFLVGVGRFVDDRFVLRQYFLRDPAEEGAMLEALREDLRPAGGFVTFNGRSFDLPLLEMRYVMGLRDRWRLTGWPHLDLLHPARRLWRRELPDCRLATLERQVLGIERSQQDVPGAEIPGLYLDYLRSGDVGPLQRVVYHNEVDVLSLVGLATEVLGRHQPGEPGHLSGAEALAVARWHELAGRTEAAEAAYQAALEAGRAAGEVRAEALRRFGGQLKRQGRFEEAADNWREWHRLAQDDPRPCIELAKYHEWHTGDLDRALAWAQRALVCLSHWPSGWRREERWAEIVHRLTRLGRKRGAQ